MIAGGAFIINGAVARFFIGEPFIGIDVSEQSLKAIMDTTVGAGRF
ncbi:hypothetical protein [Marinobacter sp. V034]